LGLVAMITLEPLAKTSAVQLDPTLAALETAESSQPNTPRLPSLNDQNIERIRHYVDGEVIFKQGDKGGETFVLLRGKVRVVLTKKKDDTYHTDWKKGKEVATIMKGESFGGMSKINPSHERTATCVAVGNVKLQVIGFTAAVLTDSINAPLVHSNKHQEQHQPDQQDGLNELMTRVTYNDGDFVCRQGEEGHCFFIITSGTVDVRIDGNNAQAEESKQLHPELWSEGGRKVHSMFAGKK
jgi:CRP-like cAMP-binding protein